eukprot:Rmarinus@m.16230
MEPAKTGRNILIHHNRVVQEFFAGALAGVAADGVVYPLDLVKTKLQSGRTSGSTIACVRDIFRAGGVRGLYTGFSPVLLATAPCSAITFVVYENVRRDIHLPPSPWKNLGAGMIGEVAALAIYVPSEVIKVNMQCSGHGIISVSSRILLSSGVRGFFAGGFSTFVRDVPFTGFSFMFFELFKNVFRNLYRPSDNFFDNLVLHGCNGALSGGLAAAITNPVDVVKTHLQLYGPWSRVPRDLYSVAQDLRRRHGPSVFTRGLFARVLWIAPASAVMFAVYEATCMWLRRQYPPVVTVSHSFEDYQKGGMDGNLGLADNKSRGGTCCVMECSSVIENCCKYSRLSPPVDASHVKWVIQ